MSNYKEELEMLSKPGDVILETIDFINMSQVELAERMGKTPSKINDIISGKEPITINTALLLEKVLDIDAQFWLNREFKYREKLLRLKELKDNENYKEWLKKQPIEDLTSLGYLSSDIDENKLIGDVLKFYGVGSPEQWYNVYVNNVQSAMYRKSNKHDNSLYGLAASLRIGEIQLRNIKPKPYNKKMFKENLFKVKELVRKHPENFAEELRELCYEAGVTVVYTPKISKSPVSGIARWIGGHPLIQLTNRYVFNDHFWFSFFHEAAHILLHGKKELFIDTDDFEKENLNPIKKKEKEIEADNFAASFLIPNDITNTLNSNEEVTEKIIRTLARDNNTHPAIILGKLQREGKVPYYFGKKLRLKVFLNDVMQTNKKSENE